MSLKTYARKRDFSKTPEPRGGARTGARAKSRKKQATGKKRAGGTTKPLSFVVQKHDATRLHYDFRLEWGGTLKSWAVPKGPSLDPADKRLAVQVEDHPLEYASFEGTIPKGQYGSGTVMVWDRGTWTPKPGMDVDAALAAGRIEFLLEGEKLRGWWTLVRMGEPEAGKPAQWLLRKQTDEDATPGKDGAITEDAALSVQTGRTLDAIARAGGPEWNSKRAAEVTKTTAKGGRSRGKRTGVAKPESVTQGERDVSAVPGARRAKMPESIQPQLATLVDRAPLGDEWVHEVKFDGYRILAFVRDGAVRLVSRNDKDWTERFSALSAPIAVLGVQSAVLDGEVVAIERDGRSSFQALRLSLDTRPGGAALKYFVFDVLYLDGFDLRGSVLTERRRLLQSLLSASDADGPVRFSDAIAGRGEDVLENACRLRLEGIISKRADAVYTSGRGKAWVKSKCTRRQELVIGGYTDPQRSRQGFGALLMGYYRAGELRYAGKVGTGFDDALLTGLSGRLKKLEVKSPVFVDPPRGFEAKGAHWVRPTMVGEVEFLEWTRDGRLRHPSFMGVREDKDAAEVVLERDVRVVEPDDTGEAEAVAGTPPAAPVAKTRTLRPAKKKASATPRSAKAPAGKAGRVKATDPDVLGVTITHPEREVYADVGVSKLEVAEYYAAVSRWMVPEVGGRPLSVVRCPQGQGKACFYQKNWDDAAVVGGHTRDIALSSTKLKCLVLDSADGLVWLTQRGVLEVHVWGCTEPDIEAPDRMVLDLDPGPGVTWTMLRDTAIEVRTHLAAVGLESGVKTTGGKGLHVLVPLLPRASWDEVKAFSKMLAVLMVNAAPERYIATMTKAKRDGKIFVDYLRNGRGATYIGAFSTRARPGAPVAMPLEWDELKRRREYPKFTVRDAVQWLEKHGNPHADLKATLLPKIGGGK